MYGLITVLAIYRIAGNFRGAYISRIDIKFIFVVTNFADGKLLRPHPHSICSPRVFYLRSVYTEYFPRPTLLGASRTLFTSLLAESIDDDGMCLDKGPPGLGRTEPEPFFK